MKQTVTTNIESLQIKVKFVISLNETKEILHRHTRGDLLCLIYSLGYSRMVGQATLRTIILQ